ncbi:serine/threonine-protein kinase [Streptomyces avicenniae]|uniref:serine/threonine-protein kinase n=1 Tax=Streptomyces avicenniae TaxID=500153 RepID=UPI000DA6311E|nr:serine/threonine-protein kinase [Streptomyces avicenniae]
MEPLAAGDPARLGDFVLRGRLGAGGMGEVFLGRSPGGRVVAVKVVHPHLARQAEFRQRFRREVEAAQTVSGAFTAPVVAAGPEDERPWIATLYVPAPSLAEAVGASGPLPEGSLWPLAAGLVEALQAIHAEGLLHRDLTPSNVLLAVDGPRVIDFGIVRAMDATALTGTGALVGTPSFMSPEQAEGGEVGTAGDVFALGAVLAFAATGRGPFGQGPPLAVLRRVVADEPLLDGLTGPLRALVAACLAKQPADRPTPAQLLGRIAAHWDPPDDFPPAPPWPETVAALIRTRAAPATAPYTGPGAVPPSLHAATTLTAPPPGAVARPDVRPPDAGPTTDPAAKPARGPRRNHWRALNLRSAGRYAEAALLLADVIAVRTRVKGPDHPLTLRTREHHAVTVGDAGEHAEAARLLADLVPLESAVLGPDHLDTLNARHLQAFHLEKLGEHAEAARLQAELAADRARVLGPDHRDTLLARHFHAYNLGEAGERAETARLLAGVAADRARIMGPDHPDTLNARFFHAYNLGEAGEHAEAAGLLAELAADLARVVGPDHPDTLTVREHHADTLDKAGEHAEAARLQAALAADQESPERSRD